MALPPLSEKKETEDGEPTWFRIPGHAGTRGGMAAGLGSGPSLAGHAQFTRRARPRNCPERPRVATEGWGASLLHPQQPDGQWAGAACNHGWNSTMHVLWLLHLMGTDPVSPEARQALERVRASVTWGGNGPAECANNPFFAGEIEQTGRRGGSLFPAHQQVTSGPGAASEPSAWILLAPCRPDAPGLARLRAHDPHFHRVYGALRHRFQPILLDYLDGPGVHAFLQSRPSPGPFIGRDAKDHRVPYGSIRSSTVVPQGSLVHGPQLPNGGLRVGIPMVCSEFDTESFELIKGMAQQ